MEEAARARRAVLLKTPTIPSVKEEAEKHSYTQEQIESVGTFEQQAHAILQAVLAPHNRPTAILLPSSLKEDKSSFLYTSGNYGTPSSALDMQDLAPKDAVADLKRMLKEYTEVLDEQTAKSINNLVRVRLHSKMEAQ